VKQILRSLLFVSSVVLLSADISSAQTTPALSPSDSAADSAELPLIKNRLTVAQGRLQDWPDLCRYAAANAALPAPTKNQKRVVFMGDSITYYWSEPGWGGFFPGKPYINRGISGQTTPQMLVRLRPDVIALHPRVAIILAGTNDIAGNTGPMTLEETEGNLASMAELVHAHGIRTVFASLLPVSNYGRGRDGKPLVQTEDRPSERILELNAWIRRYASENRYTYLDYFSAMVDGRGMLKSELSDDGLHPNARGYAVMAPLAEQAIQSALKKKR
jgi:lysophospholipase L1-like esterase